VCVILFNIYFNYLSCFECPPGSRCSHFHLGTLDFTQQDSDVFEEQDAESVDDPPEQEPFIVQPEDIMEHEEVLDSDETPGQRSPLLQQDEIFQGEQEPQTTTQQPANMKKNDWVCLTLSEQQYPGW
jgi:hypothetical protein